MSRKLKLVVQEINSLLGSDYNLISFDSMGVDGVLKIVVDVLIQLKVLAAAPQAEEFSRDNAIVKIVDALSEIKYSPGNNVSPNEFREGIAQGKRSTIQPILHWLLMNRDKVKERAYLAKYLTKVAVPIELQSEQDIVEAFAEYKETMAEFRRVHKAHKEQANKVQMNNEMRRDIEKMSVDIERIRDKVDNQRAKLDKMNVSEALLFSTKAYKTEKQQERKLKWQKKELATSVAHLRNGITGAKAEMVKRRAVLNASGGPVGLARAELQANRSLAEDILATELTALKKDLEMVRNCLTEGEPGVPHLSQLAEEEQSLRSHIVELLEAKSRRLNLKPDKLSPFRHQATAIATEKRVAVDSLMRARNELHDLDQQIAARKTQMKELIGGKVLYGDELKAYVNRLRQKSVNYRDDRTRLQGLTAEAGVLQRTKDLLGQREAHLQLTAAPKAALPATAGSDGLGEVVQLIRSLVQVRLSTQADKRRCEQLSLRDYITEEDKEKLQKLQEFRAATEEVTGEIERMEQDIVDAERQTDLEESKWRETRQEIEERERALGNIVTAPATAADRAARKRALQMQWSAPIKERENTVATLNEAKQRLDGSADEKKEQIALWVDLKEIISSKCQQVEEAEA